MNIESNERVLLEEISALIDFFLHKNPDYGDQRIKTTDLRSTLISTFLRWFLHFSSRQDFNASILTLANKDIDYFTQPISKHSENIDHDKRDSQTGAAS